MEDGKSLATQQRKQRTARPSIYLLYAWSKVLILLYSCTEGSPCGVERIENAVQRVSFQFWWEWIANFVKIAVVLFLFIIFSMFPPEGDVRRTRTQLPYQRPFITSQVFRCPRFNVLAWRCSENHGRNRIWHLTLRSTPFISRSQLARGRRS